MSDGIWIPDDVWALDLPPLHRVFLARLVALSKQDGASWAGDEFLAESLRCSPQHVRKMRGQLERLGHIVTEGYGHRRKLRVEVAPLGTSNHRNKQPEAQELQPQAQKLQPQMRQEATTDAKSIEENRKSIEIVKKAPKREIVYPWTSDAFMDAWGEWKKYKKAEKRFAFKSVTSEQTSLHKLQKDAEENEQLAIAAIGNAIANGWSGIFINAHFKREFESTQAGGGDVTAAEFAEYLRTGTIPWRS